jgi:signal transduction histidine kinase
MPVKLLYHNLVKLIQTIRPNLFLNKASQKIDRHNRTNNNNSEQYLQNTTNLAKSEFLANMSHELLTPLNAVLGFTQLMLQDSSLPDRHQQNLAIIYSNGEHLLALINDILEIAKIESNKLTLNEYCFDLPDLLASLEKQFTLRSKSPNVRLKFDYCPNLPQYICTDRQKLRQVLVNLLDNGIKYTESGTVILRVSVVADAVKKSIGNEQKIIIYFEIEDTGFGIDPSEVNSIFEAFIQGKKTPIYREGSGLGLAISQHFVNLLGGKISVSSVLDRGTVFKFHIPVSLVKQDDKIVSIDRIVDIDRKKSKRHNLSQRNRLEKTKILSCKSSFDRVPRQWIERLHQAAIEVDTDLILQLIEQISVVNFSLSEELKNMIDNFEYDEIIELTTCWS